jgi:hypothetical protein
MKTRWTLLVIVCIAITLGAMVGTAHGADLRPIVVTNLTGNLDVEQNVPCGGHVSRLAAVTGGRIDLIPSDGFDQPGANKSFVLGRVTVAFEGFTASASCGLINGSVAYGGEEVQLAHAVAFTAVPVRDGVYAFTIPKDQFLLWVIDRRDGALEESYKRPSQDVTGLMNPGTGAFSIHVVTSQRLHFQEGCVLNNCIIDEFDNGTVSADVAGTMTFPDSDADGVPDRVDNCVFFANPDQSPVPTPTIDAPPDITLASCLERSIGVATAKDVCDGGPVAITNNAPAQFPDGTTIITWTATDSKGRTATDTQKVTVLDTVKPTVSCTAMHPVGTSFVVAGSDICGGVVLTLGSYVIGNGEQIKIQETGQPGVRLQNVVSADGIRKFLVGKGESVILATDGAGNTSTAACVYPK